MLARLSVRNYALIEELELDLHPGFNAITGETGAGKSILLGAIGLLLGQRADTKALLNPDRKCVVEGEFEVRAYDLKDLFDELELDYADRTILRREIGTDGRSRAFVNDSPVRLDALRPLGDRLVDIHSQHQTLLIGKEDFQRLVLDAWSSNLAERTAYASAHHTWKERTRELNSLKGRSAASQQELDYQKFQLKELEETPLDQLDETALETEQQTLAHAEQIAEQLQRAAGLISEGEVAAEPILYEALSSLASIADFGPTYEKLRHRLDSLLEELKDLSREIDSEGQGVEGNPGRLQEVQEVMDKLFRLHKKHGTGSVAELIELRDHLRSEVAEVEDLDSAITTKEKAVAAALAEAMKAGEALHQKRAAAVGPLQEDVVLRIRELGMPEGQFEITLEKGEPQESGIDAISFLFSANKGIAPAPLGKVASGGEFSRLMFALKGGLAERTARPTLLFDEIDTGISGQVARTMGEAMRQMGEGHQVISITHLPQIAARAEAHLLVYKDHSNERTASHLRVLSESERIEALAGMIAGSYPSDSARQSARELLGVS